VLGSGARERVPDRRALLSSFGDHIVARRNPEHDAPGFGFFGQIAYRARLLRTPSNAKGLRQPFVCFAASIRASFFVQAWVSPHCGQRKGAPVQAGGNRSQASRSATISVETFLPVF
jgi:hypothetical protein